MLTVYSDSTQAPHFPAFDAAIERIKHAEIAERYRRKTKREPFSVRRAPRRGADAHRLRSIRADLAGQRRGQISCSRSSVCYPDAFLSDRLPTIGGRCASHIIWQTVFFIRQMTELISSFTQKDVDPSLALYRPSTSPYSLFKEGNGRRPLNISAVAARANTAIQRTQLIQLIQVTQMTQTPLGAPGRDRYQSPRRSM